ncbi:transporter substrate-binding domain-containing protein [Pararobbsia silviterrae]|uniref:transporter substrate-binding domain-containing protein n=1 Tax=Pararobbsia silviterrae TaxID=1792498 RepID=UPI001F0C4271|nr:transporter substrate-binding domain-containing protein [Pararobbsia silviterrae]
MESAAPNASSTAGSTNPHAGSPSPSTASTSSSATPGAAGSRLDTVLASHRLRVCTTGDYKPYAFLRPDGRYEGIDIDLAASLARSLGAEIEYVATTWPKLTDDFIGRCDIAIGGVSTTLERQKRAAFSTPYLVDGKTPIARCADVSRFQTLAQIDQPSVRVIVNPGGTNEKFAREHLSHAHLEVYPDNVTIFRQIADGKADVMITDASETMLQHKLNPSLCSVNPDTPLQFGEKAFMLPRGDVVFQQYVDQWLHLLRATGAFQPIVDAWLK